MPLARISITIPEQLVEKADDRAAELDRSRSWVVVDALKRYLSRRQIGLDPLHAPDRGEALSVHESGTRYVAGLGASRTAQLEADLRLTAEERVLAAERTLLAVAARGSAPDGVLSFERYEDYVDWKRQEAARR